MNNIIKRVWNQNRMVNIEALSGMAFQAEDGGHTFEISGINDANEAVSLSGTVAGVFMRPDGADVALNGSASDGVVSVTLSDACYAVAGRFGLTIFVTDENDQKVAVYACVGTVTRTTTGAVAGSAPQDVVDLINAIDAAVATIPADYTDLMAAIAPTYSNTALYAAKSYAWYNGMLYKCTTAITTAESWSSSHWTAAVIGNDVAEFIRYMGAGVQKSTAVSSTSYLAQITNAGNIQALSVGAKHVYIYPVVANTPYVLYGTGAYISTDTPIAAFAQTLFDGSTTMATESILINGTSSTPTDYNYLYTPASNGYVYIATYGTRPQVVVYDTEYLSSKISGLVSAINDVDDRVDHTQLIIPKELYDFSLLDLFSELESTYIDDFTYRASMIDADHPYIVSGGTSTLPTITTGTGATRTCESGVSNLFYAKSFTHFPYICLIGRVAIASQLLKLYDEFSVAIGASGAISFAGVTYGNIHENAQFYLMYVLPEGIIIIDDAGIIVRVPVVYQQGKPLSVSLGFGSEIGTLYGYGSFVELTKMPLAPLDFTRCVEYNRIGESKAKIKAAIRFTHSTWSNGAVNQDYYIPEDNPYMSLITGISNNPCIKCTLDYDTDAGYRTEIGITPIREGTLANAVGGLQRFKASADYYMDSNQNDMSENYLTYIFQLHDANFSVSGWVDGPPLSIVIKNGRLVASVAYIDDGAVPAGDNRHTVNEYDLGAFSLDEWMHLEVEARIGWRNVLAPQLVIRINGQERLNLQTPIGYNIVSSGGYVNTHFGLYCPQLHESTYAHRHREILVTNIRWAGTQKEN